MAQEQKQGTGDAAKVRGGSVRWKVVLATYALPTALCVSVLANLAGVFYSRALALASRQVATQEIPLGHYHFVADEYEPGQVTEAEFALHIQLVHQAEKPARRLLEARRQKVRQNVEELLRTAHGGDFHDPALRELKSQLQKRINETLGLRAVADVIVTELQLKRSRPLNDQVTPMKRVPWVDPSAG